LKDDLKYNITVFGSLAEPMDGDDGLTSYEIQKDFKYLDVSQNINDVIIFYDVSPTDSKIVLSMLSNKSQLAV
jgi:6-phosphogluconolactonase (cycloisomerase 2 family)